MKLRRPEVLLLSLALCVALMLLLLPKHQNSWSYAGTLKYAGTTLKTGEKSDVVTDIIGFRALIHGGDTYPILGPELSKLGIDWDVEHASTHPPSCYLMVAPVALLPINLAERAWAFLMIVCMGISFWALGFKWYNAASLAIISLLWPPVSLSLGQLTPIWLMSLCIAYRYRNTNTFVCGVWIAIASLTKLLPAVLLFLFFVRKKWGALAGFGLACLVTILILLIMQPACLRRYVEVNRENSAKQIERSDNSSPVAMAMGKLGLAGAGIVLLFYAGLIYYNRIAIFKGHDISMDAWDVMSYLAVALLPIAWAYSIMPLIGIMRGGVARLIIAILFLLFTTALQPWTMPIEFTMAILGFGASFFFKSQGELPDYLIGLRAKLSGEVADEIAQIE